MGKNKLMNIVFKKLVNQNWLYYFLLINFIIITNLVMLLYDWVNSNKNKYIELSSIVVPLIVGIVFFGVFVIVYRLILRRIIGSAINEDGEQKKSDIFELCKMCVIKKATSPLLYFGIITYPELLRIEADLGLSKEPGNCEVIVYTSHLDNEFPAKDVIKSNIESGVKYKVFYYNGELTKEIKELYSEECLIEMDQGSIDYKIHECAGFDIMVYKNSEGEIYGYYCVNFTPPQNNGCNNHSDSSQCKNPCNKNNENLFYKKISKRAVKNIYNDLYRNSGVKKDG